MENTKNNSEKRICEYCNKTLYKIGCERSNRPNSHPDWKQRKYHKSCYALKKALIDKKFQDELIQARIHEMNRKKLFLEIVKLI